LVPGGGEMVRITYKNQSTLSSGQEGVPPDFPAARLPVIRPVCARVSPGNGSSALFQGKWPIIFLYRSINPFDVTLAVTETHRSGKPNRGDIAAAECGNPQGLQTTCERFPLGVFLHPAFRGCRASQPACQSPGGAIGSVQDGQPGRPRASRCRSERVRTCLGRSQRAERPDMGHRRAWEKRSRGVVEE